jgi:hypothetical protein
MPPGLEISLPRVTFDGTTTTYTYKIKADFSGWNGASDSGIAYTAQSGASGPQSVDALITYYGKSEGPALFADSITTLTANTPYKLKGNTTRYVIIPLDTALIKDYLLKKYANEITDTSVPYLVWIEKNPAIGNVETVPEGSNWTGGLYKIAGLRISGLYDSSGPEIGGTIDNFDDGGTNRIPSIATVLAYGHTSTINFYADTSPLPNPVGLATDIKTKLAANGDWNTNPELAVIKNWMKIHKPALRIMSQWAD